MALSVSQNLFGIVESIVTSINGYFLVTVSEMNMYSVCFFICLWGFCSRVKHRMFFKKEVIFGQ